MRQKKRKQRKDPEKWKAELKRQQERKKAKALANPELAERKRII